MVLLGAGCCAGVVSVLLALRWGNADHEFLELQGLLRALPQLFFAAHCVRTAPVRLLSSARVWVRDSAAQFVAVAMIFSAFGDFILALATRYPEFFILGLLMFLLAHLSNIVSLCLAPVEVGHLQFLRIAKSSFLYSSFSSSSFSFGSSEPPRA
eukprot:m.667447 g.667447  ORF g.667447 m.667447 type:complete len:154 (-) comp58508_c0_seq9:7439-7900(-)